MTDFRATDSSGADMSIEWTDDRGARIRVGGTQPMDQPACSIKRSREEMEALRDHLDDELGDGWQPIETAPRDGTKVDLWIVGSTPIADQAPDLPQVYGGAYWAKSYKDKWWVAESYRKDGWRTGPTLSLNPRYKPTHWRPRPAPPRTPANGG